jgi:hypothetical protein
MRKVLTLWIALDAQHPQPAADNTSDKLRRRSGSVPCSVLRTYRGAPGSWL